MASVPSSTTTKRSVLRALVLEGHQPCHLVVDPARFGGEDVGFPERVLEPYPAGIPLDLHPDWPLELDLDSDPETLGMSLSFSGKVYRCHVPWRSITKIVVGSGNVGWAHEGEEPEPDPGPKPGARVGHLRVLK